MEILNKESKNFLSIAKFVKKLEISSSVLDKLGNLVKEGKFIYSVNSNLLKYSVKENDRISYIGTLIGEIKQKGFFASPEFIDFLSKYSNSKIIVKEKSEWMFLCGNDIFRSGVLKDSSKSSARNVFVQNKHGENLGLASSFKNGKYFHIIDKGAYVRKET